MLSMAAGSALLTTLLGIGGCDEKAHPCGTFAFATLDTVPHGVDVETRFSFDPKRCGPACNAQQIVYLQAWRERSLVRGEFIAFSSEHRARMVVSDDSQVGGWAIDRRDEWKRWGYFGRNDNGTYESTVQPGSNSRCAVLQDGARIHIRSEASAIDAAVCLDGDTCSNAILGYYLWSFATDGDANVSSQSSDIAPKWSREVLSRAVESWNANLGNYRYPLPALADWTPRADFAGSSAFSGFTSAEYRHFSGLARAELAAALANDSKQGVEPFNSTAYRWAVAHRDRALVPSLIPTTNDRRAFLGLLALRSIDAAAYKSLDPGRRISILVDALRKSEYFNTWGVPGLYWEDAARAIIDEGPAAESALASMLNDKNRAAPLFGSEITRINKQYAYRRRDYAWALRNAIRGRTVEIPADPTQRDALIDADM